jgi:Holliday junction resolvase RusA-like endonuclease
MPDEMTMDEPFEIEARGAAEGINPMFGEWRQRFEIEPISSSNLGPARVAFKRAVREQLRNKFVFVGEVRFTVTLFLDEQKVLETPAYGDLDNYAKVLLDALKGNGGLLIDDCQVQRLDISWLGVSGQPSFEVEFRSGPDDFMPQPVKLFEMPDGLFYPLSDMAWSRNGLVPVSQEHLLAVAKSLASLISTKRSWRHQLRQEGLPQLGAFQLTKPISPLVVGFHRSRVIDSGYEILDRRSWTSA